MRVVTRHCLSPLPRTTASHRCPLTAASHCCLLPLLLSRLTGNGYFAAWLGLGSATLILAAEDDARELLCFSPCRRSDGGCCCIKGRAAAPRKHDSDLEASAVVPPDMPASSSQVPAGIFLQVGDHAAAPPSQPAAPVP